MEQAKVIEARDRLVAFYLEYGQIMAANPPGSRKELLEELLKRIRQAKREYFAAQKGESCEKS